ncbi:methyltransferase domain-containing protein [Peredibacter sp. HCB2-198]|uniref:methyltransferase domain-containing protein n=1 Tax=Peredibacter sp. HCB2-198 TaxID=3383025 RepID=UPI0038B554FE
MKLSSELDSFVQSHLNLQVKISYPEHHDFLIRHKLNECSQVLDVGTGNGTFAVRLAQDHPNIHFVGIDKRKHCIDSCKLSQNFEAFQVDMFSRESTFDFSRFDGFLMRYFLLHVDNAQKILELFKTKSKRPSKFWIIDLDWSQFTCEPQHETFDKLTKLVKDFCSKISVESRGGQNVLPLLQKLEFQNIIVENIPFSTQTIPIDELALYLKQEIQCYSIMSGRASNDPETSEIVQFINEDFRTGKYQISYGMILVSAELN